MIDMTRAEILDVWKRLVRNMTDQGAVVPFAHEIASRVRNELLDRLEAADKERDALRKELMAAHKMAMNGTEWRDLAKKYAARIEEMELQEPVGEVVHNGESAGLYAMLAAAPGAQPEPSIPEGWKAAPVEVVDLYSFMCAAFVPMTPQQEQIALQLDLAKQAMLAAAPEAKPCP